MKKHLLATLSLIALSSSVFAIGLGNDNPGGNSTAISGSYSGAHADAYARATAQQSQMQGQAQGQDQRQFVTLSPTTGGNQLSVNLPQELPNKTITSRIETNDYAIKNVPSVFSGNVYPTAPCMGSSQVGGAGVGFGFSIGSSWTDDECGIRETARSFNSFGLKEDAVRVLCTSKYAAAAAVCKGN